MRSPPASPPAYPKTVFPRNIQTNAQNSMQSSSSSNKAGGAGSSSSRGPGGGVIGGGGNNAGGDAAAAASVGGGGAYGNGNNGPGAAQIESLKEVYLLLSNPPPPATLLLLLFSLLTAGLLVSRLFAMLISRKAVIRSQARNRRRSRLDQTITASSPGSPPTPKENRAGGDMVRSPAAGVKNNSNTAAAAATKSKQQESSISATSSYPFPQMPRSLTGNSVATAFNTTMSPGMGPHDRILPSGTTTPASFAFQPQGTQPITPFENPDFPTPNMYDLALLLHSEAGIDAFWSNIVKIATTCYKAERVTLAVPSDSTDLENTPWGQKATFNVAEDDCLSLTYMGDERGFVGDQEEVSMGEDSDGNHGVPISKERNNTMDMNGRMEGGFFGGMCDPDEDNTEPIQLERNSDEPFAPVTIGPSDPQNEDANNSDWLSETSGLSPLEPPQPPPLPPEFGRQKQNMAYAQGIEEDEQRGRVFPTLQPLNYEADALLDGTGVSRVLQRGKVVVLGREYRDIKTHLEERDKRRREAEFVAANTPKSSPSRAFSNEQRPKPKKGSIPEQASIQGVEKLDLSSISSPLQLSSQPPTPLYFVGKGMRRKKKSAQKDGASSYEEYEQALTSPWSQSPAPSPAPKQDPAENPFFAPPKVDEETFNPQTNSPVYSAQEPVNAIGFESAWTVIHIPLIHPSFSKSLNPSASAAAGGGTTTSTTGGESLLRGSFGLPSNDILSRHNMAGHKKSPIAILSMLSPVIPYPRNLIHSLSHFAPLAATAFSLAQNHSNVVNQLSHLQYRRPLRRHATDIDSGLHASLRYGLKSPDIVEGASVTSPSELSTMSKDSTSRVASPGWDIGGLGGPRQQGSDQESIRSQASTPVSPGGENLEGIRAAAAVAMATTKNEGSTVSLEVQLQTEEDEGASSAGTVKFKKGEQGTVTHKREIPRSSPLPDHVLKDLADSEKTPVLEDLGSQSSGTMESPSVSPGSESAPNRRRFPRKRKPALKIVGHNYPHTLLHSYGADYSATFQSLAATTSLPGTPLGTGRRGSTRMSSAGATSQNHQMPPPSNKLLRTIIDSIPVHVFTAAPYTGETTWVNARMLAYRGATVDEFMKGPWEAFHPEDREDYIKRWGIAVRKGEPFSHQVRVRRFDGVYRWFMIRAVPLRDSRGIIVHWFGTNMDIHDQRIAEVDAARQAEMAESESKYRSLANSSPQIVFAATAVDGISYANTQWLGYSGQTLAQALRLGFMEHVHPNDRYKCALPGLGGGGGSVSPRSVSPGGGMTSPGFETSGFSPNSYGSSTFDGGFKSPTGVDIEEEKPTFSTELRLRDKHGNYRWHLVRCVSVETNFGTGEGQWFGTCTDINDHKLLEQKLKEANEAAQKTMESKTRFLANMSHEIRTPLIGISGMVNFLLDTTLNGEQLDYCHTISQSSDGLLSVINDILDLSKVEAGMMRLNPEWFRIHSLIEDANELLSTMAIAKDLELNFIVEEDVPPVVCGDRVRLRQVLLNVIGNAIKFTSKGEVFSRCSVIQDDKIGDDDVMLQFECHDTGPGFDKKDEELMFKPFSQIDGSSTRAHGGSGLGLVISRQLVELHGGRMSASSEKGKGSTFICSAKFKLPREKPPGEGSSAVATPDAIPPIPQGIPPGITPNLAAQGRRQGILESDTITERITEFPSDTPPGLTFSDGPSSAPASSASSDPSINPVSMRLALPTEAQQKYKAYTPPASTATPSETEASVKKMPSVDSELGRAVTPPMFSILIVSEQHYSRIAIAHHIKITLPKNIPNQITTASKYDECKSLIGGDDPVVFTHIVVNLQEHTEIIALIDQILGSSIHSLTTMLVLTNPTQRTAVMQGAPQNCEHMGQRLQFIYKPIKPSRFGVIFDPANERDASMDRNRDSAQQVVETQKRVFSQMEQEVGNRGHRVLLVEDNTVNQKVLLRFLARVGLEVDTASDGEECVEKVFSQNPGHYGLILCDLHMPRKDGFQATMEIRAWEQTHNAPRVPIVALSANVMSDVADRCIAAGFSRYVSKPVDFKELSSTIKDLLLDPTQSGQFM
ncbi:uncharacterized protein LAJ45_04669 [Morchella importuna]|uniref:uncharacterized protein n=1 Tax=Morchella importuna TaxID=1174673 RepID=UPI001E8EE014|nr:uncharacterized protein LAJ45_04669 [Morchella importuna]KAH8151464.1 hypothetical protein LAJ45_04669 [Morchella importuna]